MRKVGELVEANSIDVRECAVMAVRDSLSSRLIVDLCLEQKNYLYNSATYHPCIAN